MSGRRVASHRLSRTQELIWASQRLHPATPLANMGDRIRLYGAVDPDRFVAAFDTVVSHAELLRTVVAEGTNTAHVLARPPRTTEVIDLPLGELDDWSAARISTPIDATSCVYDSVLIRHADDDWTWWIDVHHVAIDAWGAARLAEATAAAYGHDGDPVDADLTEVVATGFFTHVAGSDDDATAVAQRAAAWIEDAAAAGPNRPLGLFGERGPRTTAVERMQIPLGDLRDRIEEALEGEYRSLSAELGLLTMTAMASMILVHRLDGRSSLTVGVPVHHRTGPDASRVIGPLMELYPLTLRFDPSETHREMFRRTMRAVFDVLRRARPGESPDTPFEIVLNVTTARYGRFAGVPATREWMRSGHVDPNHVLRVQIFDQCDPAADGDDTHALRWELDLNDGLSADGSHRRLPEWFATVVGDIATRPDEPAGRIPIVGDDADELARLNPDPTPRRLDTPVHERIREELRRRPDWIVAECDGAPMSARDLDTRADRTAAWLIGAGLSKGRAVGIRMERSPDVLVAIHAVLRAGGRFVMLDPADPPARHETIRADADLLTILDELPAPTSPEAESPGGLPEVGLDDGAYILYTSGSTGEPKGVPISHRGLADYLDFACAAYCEGGDPPVVALHSSLVFDLTITSLFLSLLTGGRTVVFAGEPVEALRRITEDPRITFLKATPSQLEILTRIADAPLPLSVVVVGGEAFRRPVAERTRHACIPGVRIFNEYGPTEAVVGCMIHEYDPAADTGVDVPIGHAAPGSRLVVLDPLGRLTPPGSWGELHVGRPGMATEYLNRPELSATRFIALDLPPDEWAAAGIDGSDTALWYRTGDRARVERPGVLVFGGRQDDQLKVNGIRLEPGEVEAAMVAHPEIDTALVRLWHPRDPDTRAPDRRCVRCGLGADVPGVEIDATGVCSTCHEFARVEPQTRQWFRTDADLAAHLETARRRRSGEFDCLHLLSGGKDSTYALYQLVARGWKVHALTLDNGFISEGAKENIRRTVADLGIGHEFVTTPAMNEILRDSLDRHSNVCQGCYKTIYTLAVARADEMGIPVIVTGLSRGQFFETRLVPHQFEAGRFDPDEIDRTVLEARRVYHHTEDAVTTLLPQQRVFDDDAVFDRVEFVDFYRYVDVDLSEMYEFLERRAPWVRPADTGRSTNCLVNVAGISVHRSERGFHNYAEPYSWDVRLGHKTRDEALEELDDEIDPEEVARLLAEVGYEPKGQGVLTAWYQSRDGSDLDPDELRAFLRERLPDHAVPAAFVRVDEVPLAASAKADPDLLPAPTRFHRQGGEGVAPTTPTEETLAEIWAEVLGLESVGATDDFFDLGGASLDALEVAARIDEVFGTDIPDAAVFRDRTIRGLAAVVDAHRGGVVGTTAIDALPAPDPTAPLALSAGEEAMLFEYRSDPADTRYNVTRLYRLRGDVDVDRLESALRDVVMAHEPLHTLFDPARTRLGSADAVEFVARGTMSIEEMDAFADVRRRVPFDLDHGPLVRVDHARIADDEVAVLIGMHHITIDAGTFDTFWSQVAARAAGGPLPPLPLSYHDHTRIQAAELAGDRSHHEFWAARAARREPVAPLGVARPAPAEDDGYLERVPELRVEELRSLRHTPFAAALAAAGAVMTTFTGDPAVEIGVTTSTKDRPGTAEIVGYYLNTVATSLRVDLDATFADLTARASAEVAEVLPHRTYPFASVVRDARAAHRPVPNVSVMLAYERLEPATYPGVEATQRILASGTSVSEVTFFVQERDEGVRLGLEYRGSVISRRDAQRLLDAFADVLTDGVRDPGRTVHELTRSRRAPDLVGADLREDRLVLERLVGHVRAVPDAVAVSDAAGRALTYREFAAAIAGLTDRLEAAPGFRPQCRVGVSVGRSVDLLVAMLAAQFAGGACVPLDPTLPPARLQTLATAAHLDLLVTDDPGRTLGLEPSRLVRSGPEPDDPAMHESPHGLERRLSTIDPDSVAYVIFTSGSTGEPRGVAVSHANLAASTGARDGWYPESPDRFLVTSSPGFDSSVVGLFWPVATGGTVVLPSDDDVHDVDRLGRLISEQEISHVLMVPSLARALLDRCGDRLDGLQTFIVAGEACPTTLADRFAEVLPDVTVVNEYGPTEATVWATAHRVRPGEDPVPIGGPIPGTTVRVADRSRRGVPAGVAGELMIAGPGVTGGYVDDPVATEERFVTVDGVGWYRTGDLVREVDGVVRFLGRTDDQLNVGGVRAEPAEIERELDSLPSVDASVVVAVGTPAVLVAHLVVDDPGAFDEADLRRRLGERLPTALVPRRFVVQPSLPLSANGKLDRAAARLLPEPVSSEPPTASPTAPGGSRLAEEIMAAWRSALAPAPIELDTDFFEAGGDSLSAVEIVTDLGDRLGHDVAIATLLSGRTPGGMAAALQPLAGHESVIRPVRFRPGRPDGPVIVMTPSWDDVFGYQALAEAFPDEVEVVALAYDVQPGQVPVNRVPELVTEMARVFATLDTADRPVVILGWSIGGVSAIELAARLRTARTRVDAAVIVDTFFPGEERHLWSNRWWKYKSMMRRGAGPELRKEIRVFLARRSPHKWAAQLGRRLLRSSSTELPAPTTAPPMVGSFPAEAFGHQPTPPGVPVVLYRASTTNPDRTIARWRTVAPDIVDVEVEGRHRGFDSIMHAGKVERIAEDLVVRLRGQLPLSSRSD